MTPLQAIRNLEELKQMLDANQPHHPDAVVVARKKHQRFALSLYSQHPRGISYADIRENIDDTIAGFKKIAAEHPQASIFPEIHKKRFSIFAALGSTLTSTTTVKGWDAAD
jgi:hypothetical protein